MRLIPVSVAIILAAAPGSALADELRASPFRGVLVPDGRLAGDADATALELNPGQLGLIGGGSWALVADGWSANTPRAGRGTAALLSLPIFGSSLAAGFHWLRPTLPDEPGAYQKLQLGWGLRLGRNVGLGFGWEHLFGERYGGDDSVTVGLGMRLHPMLALGLVARDVGRPRASGDVDRLPREWEGELALRPLGTDRLEVGIGARIEQGADQPVRPRGRLSGRLVPGLAVFGELDTPRDRRAVVGAAADWRAMFGLDLQFESVGLTVAQVQSWRVDEGQGVGRGGSVALRGFPARRPTLVPTRHIERVKLVGLERDAAFIGTILRLRALADDATVGAVLLDLRGLDLGLARVQELRALIAELRRRKPVFAYFSDASTRGYYLASACDRVLMHPAGSLMLTGLSQTVTFYKSALDRLGVQVELVRIAEYKGAMEPFVMTEQSEPVKQNRNALLDDHFRRLLEDVAKTRSGLTPEVLRPLVDRALFSSEEAKKAGLVDVLTDDKDLDAALAQVTGHRWPIRESFERRDSRLWSPSRVAVVLVDGTIVDQPEGGLFSGELTSAERVVESLEQIRGDGSIRAVVLRVNSPGGSALASDRIARAVARVRKAGKPVIVSMGDVAASGGYYVAAPSDRIFASAGTTTGSIGIFAFKVDAHLLMEKLGLGTETYKRGESADLFTADRPWTGEERAKVQDQIKQMYQRFVDTVASGRGVTATRADELGRGRIYTGSQAQDLKLVDELGGFAPALDEAARRGGVPRGPGNLPEIVVLPKAPPNLVETLLRQHAGPLPILEQHGRAAVRLLAPMVTGPSSGLQARMPYDLEVR